MKKILAKSLLVIIEAGLEVLAERIKKRRLRNGNNGGLDHIRVGGGAYGLRDRSAALSSAVGGRWSMRNRRTGKRSSHKTVAEDYWDNTWANFTRLLVRKFCVTLAWLCVFLIHTVPDRLTLRFNKNNLLQLVIMSHDTLPKASRGPHNRSERHCRCLTVYGLKSR